MKFKTFQYNLYILKLAWRICPERVLADLFKSFTDFAAWIFYSIIFIKYIMHAIEVKKSFPEIMIFILVTTILFGLFELFTVWYDNKYRPKTDNIIYKEVNAFLFEKATKVEMACYEDTEFYNNYTPAIKEREIRADVQPAGGKIPCAGKRRPTGQSRLTTTFNYRGVTLNGQSIQLQRKL